MVVKILATLAFPSFALLLLSTAAARSSAENNLISKAKEVQLMDDVDNTTLAASGKVGKQAVRLNERSSSLDGFAGEDGTDRSLVETSEALTADSSPTSRAAVFPRGGYGADSNDYKKLNQQCSGTFCCCAGVHLSVQ